MGNAIVLVSPEVLKDRAPIRVSRDNKGQDLTVFIFVVCQVQTERLVKAWMSKEIPASKFAFSRPGLLTFKLDESHQALAGRAAECPFVRHCGWSLGAVQGGSDEVANVLRQEFLSRGAKDLHLWTRDQRRVGDRGFEPFSTDEDEATGREILQLLEQAESEQVRVEGIVLNQFAPANRTVLDVIRVDPDRWLVGYHRSEGGPSGWVGGVPAFKRKEVISRAYYKLEEALRWSDLPMSKGDRVVELGAAPGGACQSLLERGLKVIGVDPAMVDASLLENPNFSHWRKRSSEIRKRDLAKTKWLVCDSNNAPQHTLDSVKEIATNQRVSLRGLVLTLKLPEWKLAAELDSYAEQVASWGYDRVRLRHLAFNRQEICLVAEQPTEAPSSEI